MKRPMESDRFCGHRRVFGEIEVMTFLERCDTYPCQSFVKRKRNEQHHQEKDSRVLGRVNRAGWTALLTLSFTCGNYGLEIRAALPSLLVAIGGGSVWGCGADLAVRQLLCLVDGGLLNVGTIDIHNGRDYAEDAIEIQVIRGIAVW